MLDLQAIKTRAQARLHLATDAATLANAANAANDPVADGRPNSQLATLATLARRNAGRYALTRAESDAAHADAWDEAAIAGFQARAGLIRRHGFAAHDADDLAEGLHLRDVHADYRHLCVECRHYWTGRCGNHRRAGLHSAEVGRDLAAMLQRCPGFEPAR